MYADRKKKRNKRSTIKQVLHLIPDTTTIFTGSDLLGKLCHFYLEIGLNYRN